MKFEPLLESQAAPVPPVMSSDRMGELFIQAGRLTRAQVDKIIQLQDQSQLRFGEAAVRLQLLTEGDIQAVLAQQFNYVTASDLRLGQDPSCPLPIANAPYSPEAEAIRRIRSELLLEGRDLSPLQVAVVSPGAGEGRTYLAANLAFSFAQVGKRTLLIDADFRSPKVHGYFSMNNKKGLSGVLSGRSAITLDVMTMVLPNLYVLPAGPLPPNPLEILQDPNLSKLIQQLSLDLDVIVVDTPASMDSSDSKVIARQVGAALVVGREHHTRIAELRETVEALQSVGVRMFGTVYNRYDARYAATATTVRGLRWWPAAWRWPLRRAPR
ncbi:polysaccharide biosynthesis tyrosine autokinase [Curvibacter sp. RS43]|jgi:protein-tyrosine kinase|uniref:Polysaccharide biosynthesis tyrosine autokinase n=1 Tax=Curvibacter microcysteis TaxID=3026419 RepID=A0ABT5ME17_9BURK|nr:MULTISPECIES: polysaccharide biosynthesis tyrosine autokinase [unclassified Curvibacter]MDD0809649.1 polysaccharide biosynthesis tyrosine autokinase [Curvibacter sp. RS43]MDD0814827.1 polysaccharide biosynthesis tyrosine autokinase [Curvibacter sp. HBC28]